LENFMIDDEAEVRMSLALGKPRLSTRPSDQYSATTDVGSQDNGHGADGSDGVIRRGVSGGQGRRNGQNGKNEKGDPQ
jgi:hypothetical protein